MRDNKYDLQIDTLKESAKKSREIDLLDRRIELLKCKILNDILKELKSKNKPKNPYKHTCSTEKIFKRRK